MSPVSLPPFSPSPEAAAAILDAFTDPNSSLRDLAYTHHTTLEALSLWLAHPDIAQRLELIENTIARRTRLIAATTLPAVATMLATIVADHAHIQTTVPVNPSSLQALEHRRRANETARRAASLLLRLARFHAGGTAPRGTALQRSVPGAAALQSSSVRAGEQASSPPQAGCHHSPRLGAAQWCGAMFDAETPESPAAPQRPPTTDAGVIATSSAPTQSRTPQPAPLNPHPTDPTYLPSPPNPTPSLISARSPAPHPERPDAEPRPPPRRNARPTRLTSTPPTGR